MLEKALKSKTTIKKITTDELHNCIIHLKGGCRSSLRDVNCVMFLIKTTAMKYGT